MKKLIFVAVLLFCLCGCRKDDEIAESKPWADDPDVICIHGYAFYKNYREVTQIFENTETGLRAVECKKKSSNEDNQGGIILK